MDLLRGYRFSPELAFRVWQREVDVYKKLYRTTILGGIADPVVYLLAFGLGLGVYVNLEATRFGDLPYIQFLAPGLIASSAMIAAALEVAWNTFMRIHYDRVYHAMLATPANVEDIVVGELLWAATRALLYALIMLIVIAVLGLARSPLAVLAPLAAALGGFLFAMLGLAYTATIKHMDQLIYWFTLVITPMLLLSGVFFPLDALPATVQGIAWFLPLYHVVEISRALVLGVPSMATLGHVAWLFAATAIVFPVPAALLRRRLIR